MKGGEGWSERTVREPTWQPMRRLLPSVARLSTVSARHKRGSVPYPPRGVSVFANSDFDFNDEEYYDDEDDVSDDIRPSRHHGEYIKQVQLPDALNAALDEHTVSELRSRYKRGLEDAPADVHDFATFRLDLMYAATHRVLHEAKIRIPELAPERLLEFGAGLGPLAWAADAVFGPDDAREVIAVEPNPKLRALGEDLSSASDVRIRWTYALPSVPSEEAPFEMVSGAYALGALPPRAIDAAVVALWQRTAPGGVLALVEPATNRGFSTILRARSVLLGTPLDAEDGEDPLAAQSSSVPAIADARIIAPCPHANRCPLTPGELVLPWQRADKAAHSTTCHQQQLVVESVARRYAMRRERRGAERRIQSERFSYLLVQKHSDAPTSLPMETASWGRVLRNPRKRCGHVIMDTCLPSGEARTLTASQRKLDRSSYRRARKGRQGDTFEADLITEAAAGLVGDAESPGAQRGSGRGWEALEEYEEYYEDDDEVEAAAAGDAVEDDARAPVRWSRPSLVKQEGSLAPKTRHEQLVEAAKMNVEFADVEREAVKVAKDMMLTEDSYGANAMRTELQQRSMRGGRSRSRPRKRRSGGKRK